MTYAIVGGDARMRCLAGMLSEDNAVLDGTEALCRLHGCDCVILPVPAEKGGVLTAPFWKTPMRMAELLPLVPETALVCGGAFSADTRSLAEKCGLRLHDIMSRPEFTVGNAELTAEGAVHLLMSSLDRAICGLRILVIGFGRIGRLTSHKLLSLGAAVTVLSGKAESRAMAEAFGCAALSPDDRISGFDAVVNTAPAALLRELAPLGRDCLLLELASAPGGLDRTAAHSLGMRCIAAPGLPGKYAPKSAAALIGRTVKSIVKEQNT